MGNIALDGFIETLESTFGKYKSGMNNHIRSKLFYVTQEGYDFLLNRLIEDYDLARPPSLKVIMREVYRHKIPLNNIEYIGISVCEFCNQEYSQNLVRCPRCQRLRKYGISRMVRMGENNIESKEEPPTLEEQREVKQLLEKAGGIKGLFRKAIKREEACQMKI